MPWYAHSFEGRAEEDWETQGQHGDRVSRASGRRASKFGLGPLGETAGWLHDLGKYVRPFQDYIAGVGKATKGPDHSSAGAVYARMHLGPRIGRIVAHVVAGHHAGLTDKLLGEGQRLDRKEADLPLILQTARADGFVLPGALPPDFVASVGRKQGFALAFLIRMLLSCLVDADRTETEAATAEANGTKVERDFDATPADMAAELHRSMKAQEEMRRRDGTADDHVNRLRARVLDHVIGQAGEPPGVFTLTVPTGGGKTLTSLRFALDHAKIHQLDRVIVVIPFTSVIDQTAEVYRGALPSFADAILEHHSGFDDDEAEARQEFDQGQRSKLRLATETWAAPLVVTTAVQFFESLFAARTSRCRKLHNIANSVIVLDEAQTMPLHLLLPCVAALKELQKSYGCSVVLCTATQPALEDKPEDEGKRPEERRSFKGGFVAPRELAPDPDSLFRELDRVTIAHAGRQDDGALAARMAASPQALCIVSSRAHARDLYEAIGDLPGARHLSTLMLPEHRRRVLDEIKATLKCGEPCRVVSTSLVEAGVDFSFPLVLRAEAGLEQIVQAAGRCNRNGELGPGRKGEVLIFEAEGRKPLAGMVAHIETAKEIIRHHDRPQIPSAIQAYYEMLYRRYGAKELDRSGVLETCKSKTKTLDFPFETIAQEMQFIEDVMKPIIVPVDGKAQAALAALAHVDKSGRIARELQRYTVGVPLGVLNALLSAGAARIVRQDAFGTQFVELINLDLYRDDVGLTWSDPSFMDAAKLVV